MKTVIIAAGLGLMASITQARNVTVKADKKLYTNFSKTKHTLRHRR